MKEAEGRGLDEVLRGSRNVTLLRPELLDVVDDDKRPGLTQELLSGVSAPTKGRGNGEEN